MAMLNVDLGPPCTAKLGRMAALFALLSVACTEDIARSGQGDLLEQEREAASRPDAPSAAPLQCKDAIADLHQVFVYPGYAQLLAASTSPDGQVLLALRDAEHAMLKLVSDSGSEVDLTTLLPKPTRAVSVLSNIRHGRVLVAHPLGPTITAIDLRSRAVHWSRPLRDLSGRPRPSYEGGVLRGEWSGTELSSVKVMHIVHFADGRYSILAKEASGLYLFGFEADGSFRFRTLLVPGELISAESVEEREDGSLAISLNHAGMTRSTSPALHGITLTQPENAEGFSVVLAVSPAGEVTSIYEGPAGSGTSPRGLVTLHGRRSWFVSDTTKPVQSLLSVGDDERIAHAVETTFTPVEDLLNSMAMVDGHLFVAGLLGARIGTRGGLVSGAPFIARVDADGSVPFLCRSTPLPIPVQPVPEGSYETFSLHPTEHPLLVRTSMTTVPGGELIASQLEVYRMAALETP